jgi:hypothetical protein
MNGRYDSRMFETAGSAAQVTPTDDWPVARFPSRRLREEFLGEVKLWNKSEGLPTILTQTLRDGTSLRYWSHDGRRSIIVRLIETYGGSVSRPRAKRTARPGLV